MHISELDYPLPEELIAQEPLEPRDSSRLLVIHRDTGTLEHRIFREIGDYLRPGDLLIANESRVIPARLFGHKESGGGRVEILLLRPLEGLRWRVLAGGARTRIGSRIRLDQGDTPSPLTAEVVAMGERGERDVEFSEAPEPYLQDLGQMPLPPYIHHRLEDPERYQTVYARLPGSAAAPTAGLHFTPELMLHLRDQGIQFAFVTLHIGLDTFRPISEEHIEEHAIHREWGRLSPEVAAQINQTKLAGGRVIAVGTTSVRILETAARQGLLHSEESCPWRTISPYEGMTDLYIQPGDRFKVVDAMITNFHLPRSTLMALVMAFAGIDLIRHAYAEAIAARYRFFSFGDACLIL